MFKQLVTNTPATLIALAAAPAAVSKNIGKEITVRAISFSLHTVAVLAMALAFQGLTAAPAGASTLTGCLTTGGDLINIALGAAPSQPCGPDGTEVSIVEAPPLRSAHATSGGRWTSLGGMAPFALRRPSAPGLRGVAI